jgi:hypothetical protein
LQFPSGSIAPMPVTIGGTERIPGVAVSAESRHGWRARPADIPFFSRSLESSYSFCFISSRDLTRSLDRESGQWRRYAPRCRRRWIRIEREVRDVDG